MLKRRAVPVMDDGPPYTVRPPPLQGLPLVLLVVATVGAIAAFGTLGATYAIGVGVLGIAATGWVAWASGSGAEVVVDGEQVRIGGTELDLRAVRRIHGGERVLRYQHRGGSSASEFHPGLVIEHDGGVVAIELDAATAAAVRDRLQEAGVRAHGASVHP